ncbi:hypothetical protein [Pseudomonas capeferrum]
MMLEIIALIKEIPNVVWSAVIAALISLGGIILSNRGNNQRLIVQLQHNAEEKTKERIHAIRSEVYLSAVEFIESTNIQMSSLSSRDLTKNDITQELQVIAGAMAKLKLVAGPETSKLASELGVISGAVFLKLLSSLKPIHYEKIEIGIADDLYVETSEEAKRIQREIDALNQSGVMDYIKYQALRQAYEFSFSQSQKYAEDRASAWERHAVVLNDFNEVLMLEMKALTEAQLNLMVAARLDLGLDSDLQELRRQLELQWTVMKNEYRKAITVVS